VETSAGEGAVDFGAGVVPPPVDIEPFPDEEPYLSADQGSYGDPYPPEDPFRPEDSYTLEDPYAGGGYDAQSAPAQTPPSAQSEAPGDLDFLGAYADVDIAFTDNPGSATGQGTASATTSGLGDPSDEGPLGRYARLAQRHSGDAAPGSAPVPPPVEAHVPDPVENYADYDTAGDADIQASTEFGPAVVERILGGVIIEEIDE
jgi:DNA polymerase-3 subunit gamma/tau